MYPLRADKEAFSAKVHIKIYNSTIYFLYILQVNDLFNTFSLIYKVMPNNAIDKVRHYIHG